MDGDGELRLSLMATLAQDESRKVSERVRAGQMVSREKGILYGNGNILGYNKFGETYVVDPEQAETVRMIFDLYLQGLGGKKIGDELTRLHYKNASGAVKWDSGNILRIIRNATYMGRVVYNKSHNNNYLDQRRIINQDEDTYIISEKKFEAISSKVSLFIGRNIEFLSNTCRCFDSDMNNDITIILHNKFLQSDVYI